MQFETIQKLLHSCSMHKQNMTECKMERCALFLIMDIVSLENIVIMQIKNKVRSRQR